MSGYIKDENSLANGIPNRTISPETGSFGNATMTNKGDTSEGTNQSHEARPAPAAGFEGDQLETDDIGEVGRDEGGDAWSEGRSFSPQAAGSASVSADNDLESAAQQIADGGDHFKHGKRFSDDVKPAHKEPLHKGDHEGLSDDNLGSSLSDDTLGR